MLWVSGFSLLAMALIYKPLLLDTLDPLFLQTVSRLGPLAHGVFLTLVVLNTVIGFRAIGALMVVGLMMLPAAASRFWSRRLPVLIIIAALLGSLSVWLGLLLSFYYSLPSGRQSCWWLAVGICCPWCSVRYTVYCAARLCSHPNEV